MNKEQADFASLVVCTIYDSKAKAYAPPVTFPNEEVAIREFGVICNDPETKFYQHPTDFTLMRVGFFRQENGELVSTGKAEFLAFANDQKQVQV